jgi:hypothetical protein
VEGHLLAGNKVIIMTDARADLAKNISKIMVNARRKDLSENEREFWHRVATLCCRHFEELNGRDASPENRKEGT